MKGSILALASMCFVVTKCADNIALNKDTKQSSIWQPQSLKYPTSGIGAVDGHIYPEFEAGTKKFMCAHTDGGDNNTYWAVDLGKNVPVSNILVYLRRDCCSYQYTQLTIDVIKPLYNSCDKWNALVSGQVTCSHEQKDTKTSLNIKCKPGTVGRFVRISKPTALMTLCEVEVYSKPLTETCTCFGHGDPHYMTYDGQYIHFQGACKYTLTSYKDKTCEFAVEAKHEYRGYSRKVTYIRLVDVRYGGHVYRLHKGRTFYVDDVQKYVPFNNKGVKVYITGNKLRIDLTDCGVSVEYDGNSYFKVVVPKKMGEDLKGICGNCNGVKDDFRTKDGKDVSSSSNKYTLVGNSYEVPDDSDLFIDQCTPVRDLQNCTKAQREEADKSFCGLLNPANKDKNNPFKECIESDPEEALKKYESCIYDFCALHDDSSNVNTVICTDLHAFAELCSDYGLLIDWRTTSRCPYSCGKNSVYKASISQCQPTCVDPKAPETCTDPEKEGCQCAKGFILSHSECVPESECGCKYNDEYIPVGTEIESPDCTKVTKCQKNNYGRVELVTDNRPACGKNAVCKPKDGHYQCSCKPGMEGNPLKECYNPYCTCTASGDPHYKTFDGQMIHFQGGCKYTVASSNKAKCNFSIEAKHEFRRNNRKVSFVRLVDFKYKGRVYRLHTGKEFYVNGIRKFPPYKDCAVKVYMSGNTLRLEGPCDTVLEFNGDHYMKVTIPRNISSDIKGICGNCNGKKDDYATKEGNDVSNDQNKFNKIGDSYEVPDDTDLVYKQCRQPPSTPFCTRNQLAAAESSNCRLLKPENKLSSKFRPCIEEDTEGAQQMYESCLTDFCAFKEDPKVVCQTLETYADQCQSLGFTIQWRTEHICPKQCQANAVFKALTSACPATCTDREAPKKCKLKPREGCECLQGYVLSDTKCVKVEECGCQNEKGEYIPVGEKVESPDCKFISECKLSSGKPEFVETKREACGTNAECKLIKGHFTCQCIKGTTGNPHKECQEPTCTCLGHGDPHYKTYDGHYIHFQGACKYTLTSYKDKTCEFAVEAKHEYRGNNRKVTYIRLVDVRYGGHLYRLYKGRKFYVDEAIKCVPFNTKGVQVYLTGNKLRLDLTDCDVSVEFNGDSRFQVIVPRKIGKDLKGICGNCNGVTDDFRTKDGKDVSSSSNKYTLIGNSYEVPDDSDLFIPQCTPVRDVQNCTKPQREKADKSLCGLLNPKNKDKSPFKECIESNPEEAEKKYEACIYDFCATHSEPSIINSVICSDLEEYAEKCTAAGLLKQWRTKSRCPIDCMKQKPNTEYNPSMSGCPATCGNPNAPATCKLPNEEGCECSKGFILSNLQCVPESECGCKHNGEYLPVGEEIESPDCTTVTKCHKINGKVVLKTDKRPACGKNAVCKPKDGHYQCSCKPGMIGDALKECYNEYCTCTASGDPHYRTFDGQQIDFQGGCKYTVAASNKANCNFSIEAKHEFRRNNRRVSFVRLVDFKYNGNVYRLHQAKEFYVNGIRKFLPYQDGEVKVYISANTLRLEGPCDTVLEFNGNHYMKVTIPRNIGSDIKGICGNCNGKKDDYATKEGNDVSNDQNKFNKIGDSYEVPDDTDLVYKQCRQPTTIKFCTKDKLPAAESSLCRLLKPENKLSSAFKDCIEENTEAAQQMYNFCLTDFCAFNEDPSVVCQTLETYADHCKTLGYTIHWRAENICPGKCQANATFKALASACPATCTDRDAPKNCKLKPKEGCECQQEYVLSDTKCVKVEECGCHNEKGEYIPVGEKFESPDCKFVSECVLSSGNPTFVKTQRQACGKNAECRLKTGQYKCVCETGTKGDPHTECKVPECSTKADMIFILDASGSVGESNFEKMKKFVMDMVDTFDIGTNKVRIGVMTFSNQANIAFNLNKYSSKNGIKDAIKDIQYTRGLTYTDLALLKMRTAMFTTAAGDRTDVPNLGIIITDGQSTKAAKTKTEAEAVHAAKIQMFAIGVSNAKQEELNLIASKPENVENIKDFNKLEEIFAKFQLKTCGGIDDDSRR